MSVNSEKLGTATNVQHVTQTDENREIFHDTEDGVKFRNVSWQGATIIFLKIQFAMSILAVPGALATLGAVGGALSIVGWQTLNTYTSVILGEFRNRHPECHSTSPSYVYISCMLTYEQLSLTCAVDFGDASARNSLVSKS